MRHPLIISINQNLLPLLIDRNKCGYSHFDKKSNFDMRKYFYLIISIALLTLQSCKSDPTVDEKKVEQILGDGNDYQELIRNPITADKNADTVNIAKADFPVVMHDFGDVKEGTVVSHTFKFSSVGKIPLIIKDATSTCGCTVPDFPKDPLSPGENAEIKVKFNTENKEGHQSKVITVFTNGYPSKYILTVNAHVK